MAKRKHIVAKGRKVVIKEMKKAIIAHLKAKKKRICKRFTLTKKEEELEKAENPITWVRTEVYKPISYDYETIHEFDCRPYEGMLTAYVYMNNAQTEIINVYIEAE